MMDCKEYRRLLLTDPSRPDVEMRAHVASCHDCTKYHAGVLRFEERLAQALQVDGEATRSGRAVPARPGLLRSSGAVSRRRHRGLAIAASVVLATFGAGFLWLAAPGRTLAAAVVNHMAGEPDAWARTAAVVSEDKLDAVMSASGAHLEPSAGRVSYVHSCEFRGHQVPHLVVQTAAGPVTVMLLVHESVTHRVRFDEQGYRGMIVPVPEHGSIAVLGQSAGSDRKTIDTVSAEVLGALDWTR